MLKNIFIIVLIGFIFSFCTNYTSKPLSIHPVILLSPLSGSSSTTQIIGIEKTSTGHVIRVSALNNEFTFKGYKIYQAPTEEGVQNLNPSLGVNCENLIQLPNTPTIYTFEVSLNPLGLANLCTFPTNLISGYYVSIRVVYFNGLGQEDGVSSPSNTLLIP
ncbi:MAG: hypothetical protein ACK4UJ_10025 [Leptonema sp. (in: bacteria)]